MSTLIFLFVIALIKSITFSFFGFGLLDEGESLNNAQRIIEGAIPYRDFFAIFPPVDNYFFAGIFKVFGQSVLIPRLIMSIIFSFLPPLIYLLVKKVTDAKFAILPAILLIFLDVNIERLYLYTPLLLGFYLFILGLERLNKKLFFLSGFLLGLVALVRIDMPAAFLLGSSIGLFIYALLKKITFKNVFGFIFLSGIGFSIPLLVMIFWMIRADIFWLFINSAFIQSVHIEELQGLPFPKPSDLIPWPFTTNIFYNNYFTLYTYSLLASYIIMLTILVKEKSLFIKKPLLGISLIIGILILPYIFGRTDMGHLLKASLPFFVVGTFLFSKAMNSKKVFLKLVSIIIVAIFFSVNIAQSFWWMGFNNSKLNVNGYTIMTNLDYVSGTTKPSSRTLEESVEFITTNTKKEDKVLLLPYMAGLYFLANRQPPNKYNNLLNGFITDENGEKEFIKNMEDENVRFIVYDRDNGPKMKNPLLKQYNFLIDQYIMEHFEVVKMTNEGWLFMRRKDVG